MLSLSTYRIGISLKIRRVLLSLPLFAALQLGFAPAVWAQSGDAATPTPIRNNEINSSIAPREPGDARLTRHFYLLRGTPGELEVTVESSGLEGDVDLYIADGLRPLVKIPLYVASEATRISKTVFLRREERLILRVEARATGDVAGTYRIRFSGAFAPELNAPEMVESPLLVAPPPVGELRTATGGRIAGAPAERSAERTTEEKAKTVTKEAAEEAKREAAVATSDDKTPRAAARNVEAPSATRAEEVTRETEPRPAPRRRASRRTPRVRPAPAPPPLASGRLVLELRDGTRIEREMRAVRRFTVDRNQVVIVGDDGRIERLSLADVVRIAIEQ